MAEHTPSEVSPEEYRGGASEPDEAKAGAGAIAKGLVPDEASDDAPPPESSDPQAMSDDALGDFPEGDHDAGDSIDLSAGDNADATSQGGSGGARGSEAGLGRHEDATIDESDPDQTLDD